MLNFQGLSWLDPSNWNRWGIGRDFAGKFHHQSPAVWLGSEEKKAKMIPTWNDGISTTLNQGVNLGDKFPSKKMESQLKGQHGEADRWLRYWCLPTSIPNILSQALGTWADIEPSRRPWFSSWTIQHLELCQKLEHVGSPKIPCYKHHGFYHFPHEKCYKLGWVLPHVETNPNSCLCI